MNNRWSKCSQYLYTVVIILGFWLACADYPTRPEIRDSGINMAVTLKKGTVLMAPRATLTVSASDMELIEDTLTYNGNSFTGEFQIPSGRRRLFSVVVYDEDLVMYRGSQESDVIAGQVSDLQLLLTSAIDSLRGRREVEAANDTLGNVLFIMINETIDNAVKPSDIDFSQVNTLYKTALESDGTNLDANFGAGMIEMMMITVDPEVNAVYDRWEAYLDTANIFGVQQGGLGKVSLTFPKTIARMPSSSQAIVRYSLGTLRGIADNNPVISDLQDLITTELIPRIDYAIRRLERVDENPDYRFIITPQMLGDLLEDPLEIDLTEIRITLSQLYTMRAALKIVTAYNLSFVDYDSLSMLNALSQSSEYLTLTPEGANRMSSVKTDLHHAIDKFSQALDFFENEIDDQTDDIIKRGPDQITTENIADARGYIEDARQCLNSSYIFTEDWDNDPGTIDQDIEVRLGALFDAPVADMKALLPEYTVEIRRDTTYNFLDNKTQFYPVTVTAEVPQYGTYNYSYYRNWDKNEDEYAIDPPYGSLDIPQLTEKMDSLFMAYTSMDTIGYLNISVYVYEVMDSGTVTLNPIIELHYATVGIDNIYYYPYLLWTADSFDEWALPNPTFNGLFPGMTDRRFKGLFGITADDWRKSVNLNWTDLR